MGYNIDIELHLPDSMTTEELDKLKFEIFKQGEIKGWGYADFIEFIDSKEVYDISYHFLEAFIYMLKNFKVKGLFIFECLGEDGQHYRKLYKEGKDIDQIPELLYPPVPDDMK